MWGSDWGENGYAKIMAQDKSTQLDFYAIGVAAYQETMAEAYARQDFMQQQRAAQQEEQEEGSDELNIDLDN